MQRTWVPWAAWAYFSPPWDVLIGISSEEKHQRDTWGWKIFICIKKEWNTMDLCKNTCLRPERTLPQTGGRIPLRGRQRRKKLAKPLIEDAVFGRPYFVVLEDFTWKYEIWSFSNIFEVMLEAHINSNATINLGKSLHSLKKLLTYKELSGATKKEVEMPTLTHTNGMYNIHGGQPACA